MSLRVNDPPLKPHKTSRMVFSLSSELTFSPNPAWPWGSISIKRTCFPFRANTAAGLAPELEVYLLASRARSDERTLELNVAGDAPCLDDLLCKTDGLRADWSDGDHQNDIDVVLDQKVSDHRKGVFDESVGGGDRAHDREMPWCYGTDLAGCRELV